MINLSIEDGIAVIGFDNPPKGFLDLPQVQRLSEILDDLEGNPDVGVLVLTGAMDGVFIRHYDVEEEAEIARRFKRSKKTDEELALAVRGENPISASFSALESFSRPTIAAINGYCQGGGLELALCCDFRIAAEGDYRIGLPEVHLGITPGGGGTCRLPRLIGLAKALDLILRGRALNPQQALSCGLVNEVVPDALARSCALAEELNALPRAAVAASKKLVRAAAGQLDEQLANERVAFAMLLRNEPSAAQSIEAFNEFPGDINEYIDHRRRKP